jgi:molybdopterin converting factor small subunit
MSVTFHIPGPLRPFTGGLSEVHVADIAGIEAGAPATLRDALQALWEMYPGLRDRIATEQGLIREHINLFVGNENARYTGALTTPLQDGAVISIVPAISGGSKH